MSGDIAPQPPPAGFGQCRRCAYVRTGPVSVCHECALEEVRAPQDPNCAICHQALPSPDAACLNKLCNDPNRAFDGTVVIGVKEGVLETGIERLKAGQHGWGMVFARIVLGHLYAYPELIDGVDAIIAMPAYIPTQEPRKGNEHTGYVIERAIEEDDRELPFILDPPLIEKTKPTTKMRETTSAAERKHVAGVLYHYLTVPNPKAVNGKHIMVYDDVFTGGNTLNAVARRLKTAGAAEVRGLVLGRQKWR
jgi:predicted amidophosphoribosyltransferase